MGPCDAQARVALAHDLLDPTRFADDLVQLGYSLSEASWLGERVCRDEYGVYNEEYIADRFKQLLAQNPPGKK